MKKTLMAAMLAIGASGCASTSPMPPMDCPVIKGPPKDLPKVGETVTQPLLDKRLKILKSPVQ